MNYASVIQLILAINFGVGFPIYSIFGVLLEWPLIFWGSRTGLIRSLGITALMNFASAFAIIYFSLPLTLYSETGFGLFLLLAIRLCDSTLFFWCLAYLLSVVLSTSFEALAFRSIKKRILKEAPYSQYSRLMKGIVLANMISVGVAFISLELSKKDPAKTTQAFPPKADDVSN